LPLRLRVLHHELHWSRLHDATAESFRDAFDADAVQFGYFDGTAFAGALRMIIRDEIGKLPSGSFFPSVCNFSGRVAEMSRGLVYPSFRRRGFFALLVRACLQRAASEGVLHLFVSSANNAESLAFYHKFGFIPIGAPFGYSDKLIEPEGLGILLYARLA
jgi:GNAT superfamily N-acetyltransferase